MKIKQIDGNEVLNNIQNPNLYKFCRTKGDTFSAKKVQCMEISTLLKSIERGDIFFIIEGVKEDMDNAEAE